MSIKTYPNTTTYPALNKIIVEMLRTDNSSTMQYAAQRIEELEICYDTLKEVLAETNAYHVLYKNYPLHESLMVKIRTAIAANTNKE